MIEDDAKFYLYATSGIHKGTIPIGDIQDLSTNWIGGYQACCLAVCIQGQRACAFLCCPLPNHA